MFIITPEKYICIEVPGSEGSEGVTGGLDGHTGRPTDVFDFFFTANWDRFPFFLLICYLQYIRDILFFFGKENRIGMYRSKPIKKVRKHEGLRKQVVSIVRTVHACTPLLSVSVPLHHFAFVFVFDGTFTPDSFHFFVRL